jgi:hypothetical protein
MKGLCKIMCRTFLNRKSNPSVYKIGEQVSVINSMVYISFKNGSTGLRRSSIYDIFRYSRLFRIYVNKSLRSSHLPGMSLLKQLVSELKRSKLRAASLSRSGTYIGGHPCSLSRWRQNQGMVILLDGRNCTRDILYMKFVSFGAEATKQQGTKRMLDPCYRLAITKVSKVRAW